MEFVFSARRICCFMYVQSFFEIILKLGNESGILVDT